MISVELNDVLVACILVVELLRVVWLDEVILETHCEEGRDEAFVNVLDRG